MYSKSDQIEFEKAIKFLVFNINATGHNPKPVILHSIRVAMYLYDRQSEADTVISAFLHDLLEDTACTYADLQDNFGVNIADTVQALTFDASIMDRKKRNEKEIDKAVSFGRVASLVKAADLIDNSLFYHLAPNDLQPILTQKFSYFIEVAKNTLDKENIWQDLLTREKEIKQIIGKKQ